LGSHARREILAALEKSASNSPGVDPITVEALGGRVRLGGLMEPRARDDLARALRAGTLKGALGAAAVEDLCAAIGVPLPSSHDRLDEGKAAVSRAVDRRGLPMFEAQRLFEGLDDAEENRGGGDQENQRRRAWSSEPSGSPSRSPDVIRSVGANPLAHNGLSGSGWGKGLGFDNVDASDIYTDDELEQILRGSVLPRQGL